MLGQDESVVRNVAILFDEVARRKLIAASEKINSKVGSVVVLNETNQLPHLTVYQTKYPKSNEELIGKKLRELAREMGSFELELAPVSTAFGFVYLDALPNGLLDDLHERVVGVVNPWREGMVIEELFDLPGISVQQTEYLKEYGHPLVKEEFLPHVTLAKPEKIEEVDEAKVVVSGEIKLRVEVEAIHLTLRGPNGTCPGVTETFVFGRAGA